MQTTTLPSFHETNVVLSTSLGVFALTPEGATKINADGQPDLTQTISQPLVHDFFTADGHSWLLASDASQKRLFLSFLSNLHDHALFVTDLPYSPDLRIRDVKDEFVTLYDQTTKDLTLIDSKAEPPIIFHLSGIRSFQWSKDHTQLLTASEFEMVIYHIHYGKDQELILRQSTPITQAMFDPTERQVIYATEQGIYAIERDDRDRRNIYPLVENKTNPLILDFDEKGRNLSFFSINAKTTSVFWNLGIHD